MVTAPLVHLTNQITHTSLVIGLGTIFTASLFCGLIDRLRGVGGTMSTSDYSYITIFEGILLYASEAPTYHIILEVALVLWIIKLLFFTQKYHPNASDKPTPEEEESLIHDWEPEPLVPPLSDDNKVPESPIVTGMTGTYVTVDGKKCLNLATFNFLGLLNKKNIHEVAETTIKKYGVGSCGPRGFYGTMDVHIDLEEKLAEFTGREEAIVYSFGFAAIASAIPAYSKRGDIIFCDEGVGFAVQKGLSASRSQLKYFKHNDMEDLEKLLLDQEKKDKRNPDKAKKARKFIVAEALYMNYGDLVPLKKLVEFRKRFGVAIILEESLSFGVLGKTGKGAVEHFNLTNDDVDIVCASMSLSMATMGGFCAGKTFVIDHQRLSGVGYCFSASLPPFLATAGSEALSIMKESPAMFQELREKAKLFRQLLNDISEIRVEGFEESPLIHIYLAHSQGSRELDKNLLDQIVSDCYQEGIAIVTAKYLESQEHNLPPPSIRLAVSVEHTKEELTKGAQVLKNVFEKRCQ